MGVLSATKKNGGEIKKKDSETGPFLFDASTIYTVRRNLSFVTRKRYILTE